MPLPDSILELVFPYLLEVGDEADSRHVALPVCRLLQTRRMRGFDYVILRVCRMGLRWALREKAFAESVNDYYRLEMRRLVPVSIRRLENVWNV
jgi:hypothetical protein